MAEKTKLEIRTAIKKRKPTYRRRQSNQYAKIAKNDAWRRPKGMGNKSRRNRRGHIGMLKVGYGSPKSVRGANRDGLFEVVIGNIEQLKLVDSKTHVGVISRTVGDKKKLAILEFAQKEKLSIGNVGNISAKIDEIKSKRVSKEDTKNKKPSSTPKKDTKKAESKSQPKSDLKKDDSKVSKSSVPKSSVVKEEEKVPNNVKEETTPVTKKVTTTTTTTTTTTKKVNATAASAKKSSVETKEVSNK
ncbi:MAG: hypothetical protein LAT82_02920 [Nanoarchaeota archaeon]|nr:hypothetical protein [Nanoarchaeota archaeon]